MIQTILLLAATLLVAPAAAFHKLPAFPPPGECPEVEAAEFVLDRFSLGRYR